MNPEERVVYLTFDDGPQPDTTPVILDILREEAVPASFFMVGANVARYPELYEQILKEGHSVGSHTYNHVSGFKLSLSAYMDEVKRGHAILQTQEHKLFRPPYGRMTLREKNTLLKQGYTIVLWDVMTHDWDKEYYADKILNIVKRYTRNGSIINCHDSLKAKAQIVPALRPMIQWLKSEGYAFGKL